MKRFDHVDFNKYEKKPISDNVDEIRKEIKALREENFNTGLSPIEHQLIYDRIAECERKIRALKEHEVKITPVLRTLTIGQTKKMHKDNFKLGENSLYI